VGESGFASAIVEGLGETLVEKDDIWLDGTLEPLVPAALAPADLANAESLAHLSIRVLHAADWANGAEVVPVSMNHLLFAHPTLQVQVVSILCEDFVDDTFVIE